MYLCEHSDEDFDEIDIDTPIEGVCFLVLTEFNLSNRAVKTLLKKKPEPFEPDPYSTHPEAMETAGEYAAEIQKIFQGSTVKKVEVEMREDEFHLYIIDKTNIPIAKIGVVGLDYRGLTIH